MLRDIGVRFCFYDISIFTCHHHPCKLGLRMIDPPFTSVKQSIGLAKGEAESISFINALITQSIENS
jgi:hypothetical protein